MKNDSLLCRNRENRCLVIRFELPDGEEPINEDVMDAAAYACGGYYNPIENYNAGFEFTTEEILAELNARPHVPNKKEAKEIRRQKAMSR